VGEVANVNVRVAARRPALHSAELDLEFTRVRAPFSDGSSISTSRTAPSRAAGRGLHARRHRHWYVMANFRETQLRHIPAGASVDIYLQSHAGRRFRGTVVASAGPCCPRTEPALNGLPRVERSLDWIRLAARFPVRIKVEDPGRLLPHRASAVTTVHGSLKSVSRDASRVRRLSPPRARADAGRGSATFRLTLPA